MSLHIVVLDRDTLPEAAFHFPFPYTLTEYTQTDAADTFNRIQDADIVISNKVVLGDAEMAAAPKLKLIAVSATGYNNIDIQAAQQRGITVCNIRAYGNESVAEHAFMLMITLMRNLPAYQRDVAAGMWQNAASFCHFGAPIRDLNGKTLAIIGKGNIGKTLARYAEAFHMKVIFAEHKHATTTRPGYTPFQEAIHQADVVSLHCPLTADTAGLIDETVLQNMKPQAVLINCGRGGLVDEHALIAALKYGQLGGAGFDVLSQEPPPADHPLIKNRLPNLIVTPHIAWGSNEARANLFRILNENINCFVAGTPQNVVV